MIEENEKKVKKDKNTAVWYNGDLDELKIAYLANDILVNGVTEVSVKPECIGYLWPYLEKEQVHILTRYYFSIQDNDVEKAIYNLSKSVTEFNGQGAIETQIFVSVCDFECFVENIINIRDDLFFNHKLCIALYLEDIEVLNIERLFYLLRYVKADAVLFSDKNTEIDDNVFIAKIYSLIQEWNFDGNIYFSLRNDEKKVSLIKVLLEYSEPELLDKTVFFLEI